MKLYRVLEATGRIYVHIYFKRLEIDNNFRITKLNAWYRALMRLQIVILHLFFFFFIWIELHNLVFINFAHKSIRIIKVCYQNLNDFVRYLKIFNAHLYWFCVCREETSVCWSLKLTCEVVCRKNQFN